MNDFFGEFGRGWHGLDVLRTNDHGSVNNGDTKSFQNVVRNGGSFVIVFVISFSHCHSCR